MSVYRLRNTSGDQSIGVPRGRPFIIGRAVTSDLPIYDPTVSRQHAELTVSNNGVTVRDLGSSNGTFVNGGRVTNAALTSGDVVRFGNVAYNFEELMTEPIAIQHPAPAPPPPATIIRKVDVPRSGPFDRPPAYPGFHDSEQGVPSGTAPEATKLNLLLNISKELARPQEVDELLEKVVDITFQVMAVDRASIMMVEDGSRSLLPRISKNKSGESDPTRHVPTSIAERCVAERLAILTDNAAADTRFAGQSILAQSVRSAMCCPLLRSDGTVLGILYVDSSTAISSFDDEDLGFLIAFSGIAAVAIENSDLTKRLAREAVVLSNFQRYFAPNLIEQISRQDAVHLGGARRPVAILFSDIRGFTSISATLGPDAIANLLTEYFTEMVEIVFDHGGTLDKFMGDALMALWGAPIAQSDDADRALSAALDMMQTLDKLNQQWLAHDRTPLSVGIGIDYGEVFAGNIGSDRRMEYTVIGDSVNVAKRLCDHASGGDVLVSGPFYEELRTKPRADQLDIQIKGKRDDVIAYRVKR